MVVLFGAQTLGAYIRCGAIGFVKQWISPDADSGKGANACVHHCVRIPCLPLRFRKPQ